MHARTLQRAAASPQRTASPASLLHQRQVLAAAAGAAAPPPAAPPQADKKPSAAPATPAPAAAPAPSAGPLLNVIPRNGRDAGRAVNGIPPVMGAHLMASGAASPLSISKGPGLDITPHQFQYPGREGESSVVLHFSKQGVAQATVKAVLEAAEAAIAAKGSFTLVLSGGSLLNLLRGLADAKAAWDEWHIFYVDERNVPHSSPDSNHKGAMNAFLGKVPIPTNNVHAILENVPVQQAAISYEGQLIMLPPSVLPRNSEGWPIFDLILLGIGPDGHIASLFPNRPQTAVTSGWVVPVLDSPKPPAERISLTLPTINAAKEIILVAIGAEKAEVVQRLLEVQALPGALPAQLVRPSAGSYKVFLDVPSAENLDITNWSNTKQFPRSL